MHAGKMDPMKDAISRKRKAGIDLTITIEPSGDDKKTDLAPKGANPPVPGSPAEEAMESPDQESQEMSGLPAGEHDHGMMQELIGQMSPHDMEDMKNRKPRSLGERARMAAMDKMGK